MVQQEEKILVQSDAFISLLTKRGILAEQKIDSEKVCSAKWEKTRNSYHNTLMLLLQYRTIVWMMECFPETIAEKLEKPFEGVDVLTGIWMWKWLWGTGSWRTGWMASRNQGCSWIR